MLPNHSPLVIAEQFGTLESLYPGRIDLGPRPRARLRPAHGARDAPQSRVRPGRVSARRAGARRLLLRVAAPAGACGARNRPPCAHLILGSSLFGGAARRRARAAVCLRLALRAGADDAGHRDLPRGVPPLGAARAALRDARLQRVRGRHDRGSAVPRDLDAAGLRQPAQRPAFDPAAPPLAGYVERLGPPERALLDQVLSCSAVGSPEVVRAALRAFVQRTGADELMITLADLRSRGAPALLRDHRRDGCRRLRPWRRKCKPGQCSVEPGSCLRRGA